MSELGDCCCSSCRVSDLDCDAGYCGDAKAKKLGVTQLKSPMSTRSKVSYLARNGTWISDMPLKMILYTFFGREVGEKKAKGILLQAKILQAADGFLLRLPNTINDVLDGKNVVRLAVASISEWHARRIHLDERRQRKMRRPVLYEHHVACQHARGVCPTYTKFRKDISATC